jgi:hypothetical protein
MDVTKLKRNPQRVHACLQELEDGRLVATRTVKIYIPTRFEERSMAEIGVESYIVGVYAMVTEDGDYAVSTVCAMHRIEPAATNKVSVGETEYYEFVFTPGSTVFTTLNLVRSKPLVYAIYSELISKGRVPWYLSYEDMAHIFDTAKSHAGTNVGSDHETIELLVSIIARDGADRTKYRRQTVTTDAEEQSTPVTWVPLKSVVYAATNTMNKIAGSYMQDGIVSALVSPAERSEHIESLIRA